MSSFDYYEPDPALRCPACGALLEGWRGTDGPADLLVWRQGSAAPVAQRNGAAQPRDAAALAALRLPNVFRMQVACCSSRFAVEAVGRAPNGTWSSTELVTAATAQRERDERMEDFKSRLRWLQGGHR